MKNDNPLQPCPFCGHSDHDRFDEQIPSVGRLCWIQCGSCKATGPHKKTPEEATVAWHRRVLDGEPRGVDLTALQSFVAGLRGLHEGGRWWWEYLAMVDVS